MNSSYTHTHIYIHTHTQVIQSHVSPSSYTSMVSSICTLLASVGEGEPAPEGHEADLFEDLRYQALSALEAILQSLGDNKGTYACIYVFACMYVCTRET